MRENNCADPSSAFAIKFDCADPPSFPNGKGFGCDGARWDSGKPSRQYCLYDARYPWWAACCKWEGDEDDGTCLPTSEPFPPPPPPVAPAGLPPAAAPYKPAPDQVFTLAAAFPVKHLWVHTKSEVAENNIVRYWNTTANPTPDTPNQKNLFLAKTTGQPGEFFLYSGQKEKESSCLKQRPGCPESHPFLLRRGTTPEVIFAI